MQAVHFNIDRFARSRHPVLAYRLEVLKFVLYSIYRRPAAVIQLNTSSVDSRLAANNNNTVNKILSQQV
jgi:hypothetical protein